VDALHYGAATREFYDLHAFVVMPNHVHVVWSPKIEMPRILQWLKGRDCKTGYGDFGLGCESLLAG
jgi:REP element-mobilizing transposase RayT